MGYSSGFLITVLGIWWLGAVHVPLSTALTPPAVALRLSGCGANTALKPVRPRPRMRVEPRS
jgi:acetyl-CoA synthetase